MTSWLFDPHGLLCQLVTKSKIVLQELWIQKLNWDESTLLGLYTSWENFKANLTLIKYHFAPLKAKSLPRLELCAAHLLAKLWNRIKRMMNFKIYDVYFWTDSVIILHWIKSHPSSLTTNVGSLRFMSGRTKFSGATCLTKQNPVDIMSRGSDVKDLKNLIWRTVVSIKRHFQMACLWTFWIKREPKVILNETSACISCSRGGASNCLLNMISKYSSYKKLHVLYWKN